MRALLVIPLLLALAAPARADEKPVPLKGAPELETVESVCSLCHSLDYIRINAPFLTAQAWQAEVDKMINVFGAPADADQAKMIVDYLVRNYGKPG
jgi:sulfite dehydrogenase (cytochrome) subunit B